MHIEWLMFIGKLKTTCTKFHSDVKEPLIFNPIDFMAIVTLFLPDGASGCYEHSGACLHAMCTTNACLGAMSTRVLVWASSLPGGIGTVPGGIKRDSEISPNTRKKILVLL